MRKSITLYFYWAILINGLLLVSCKSDEATPSSSIEILSGNNQRGIQGEYISEPVVIKVNSSIPYNQLALQRQAIGAGSLVADKYDPEARAFVLDENYEARVYFSLTCEPGDQNIRIAIQEISCPANEECPTLAEAEVTVRVEKSSSSWQILTDFPGGRKIVEYHELAYTFNAPFSTQNNSDFLISADYKRWDLASSLQSRIVDFDILSDGTFVLMTTNEILFSTNGVNWDAKTNGLPEAGEFKFPTQLLAEDSVIFVNYSETDIDFSSNWFRSRDKGNSWEPLITPLADYPIIRANNGDLFGLSTEFTDSIYRSNDSGNTWESLQFNGTLTGRIQEIHADENNNLLILAAQTGSLGSGSASRLYQLHTQTLELVEVETPVDIAHISRLFVYNGIPYFISGQNFYKKTDSWQFIKGPESSYPSVQGGYFPAGFDYLYVKENGQYLLTSYFANTYCNFIN